MTTSARTGLPPAVVPDLVEVSLGDWEGGEFRIRVTGRPRTGDTTQRQIIATFRPKGFLNYIYYTDYETLDPKLYPFVTDGLTTTSTSQGDYLTWATNNCGVTRWLKAEKRTKACWPFRTWSMSFGCNRASICRSSESGTTSMMASPARMTPRMVCAVS